MYLLGQEAMVANPQGSVAGGHVARSTGGHLPHSGPRHPGNHCGDTNLHGPQGSREPAKLQAVMLLAGCLEECLFSLQVHGRCKKNNISGSKHYLTVASGVMMSVFVSPVIAAVTVGKKPQQPG